MGQVINTFTRGIDADTDISLVSKDTYRKAVNFRIAAGPGAFTGALRSVEGAFQFIQNNGDSRKSIFTNEDQMVVGGCELRDKLVIFTTNIQRQDPENTPGGGRSQIYVLDVNLHADIIENVELIYDDTLNSGGKLFFSTFHPIKAVSRYETENIQKVYWTDNHNVIRVINIGMPATTTGAPASYPSVPFISADKLSFLPDANLTKPEVVASVSGKIQSGMLFYSYQLYYHYGAETTYSPISSAIHVTSASDLDGNTKYYQGDTESKDTGKGFKVQISNISGNYNRIRLIRLLYKTQDGIPEIDIAAEAVLEPGVDVINIIDSGQTLGELTVDEFNIISGQSFVCADIAIKDNILFAANIKDEQFDIDDDFDCRAVRFNSSGVARVLSNSSLAHAQINITSVSDEAWKDSGNSSFYPANHDGINAFNNCDNDGNASFEYKYQKTNNSKLGAEGPNVVVGFVTEPMILDNATNTVHTFYAESDSSNDMGSYENFANPTMAGKASWQRDETYRLFAVFRNAKGQPSFPRWICDLRMPSLFEQGVTGENNAALMASTLASGNSSTSYGDLSITTSHPDFDVQYPTQWDPVLGDNVPSNTYSVTCGIDNLSNHLALPTGVTLQNVFAAHTTAFSLTWVDAVSVSTTFTSPSGNDLRVEAITYNAALDSLSFTIISTNLELYTDQIYNITAATLSMQVEGSLDGYAPDNVTYTNLLYPTIKFKNLPNGAVSAQVYRCIRRKEDRTIMTQGVGLPFSYNDREDVEAWGPPLRGSLERIGGSTSKVWRLDSIGTSSVPVSTALSDGTKVMRLVSPEILYATEFSVPASRAYLDYVTNYSDSTSTKNWHTIHYQPGSTYMQNALYGYKAVKNVPSTASRSSIKNNVVDTKKLNFLDYSKQSFGGTSFRNYAGDIDWTGLFDNSGHEYGSYGCTSLLVEHDNINPFTNQYIPILNYKVNRFDSQYGGNTFNSRLGNTCIPCSEVIKSTSNYSVMKGGDTFINYFEVMTDMFDLNILGGTSKDDRTTWSNLLYVPLESSINLDLTTSKSAMHRQLTNTTDLNWARMTQEIAGDYYCYKDPTNKVHYKQENNLYMYNGVYSQQPILSILQPKPADKLLENEFDYKIQASKEKVGGELSDSWSKFGVNETIEVESKYGPIHALTNFNNQLYYFQDFAVGVASVNAQSVITDNNSAQLALGTGTVLSRFDYVTTHAGCMDKFAIATSKYGLYWIDRMANAFFKYSDSLVNMGITKGISSIIKTYSEHWDTDIDTRRLLVFADKQHDEILFTYTSDYGTPFTIAFSEIADAFISFYSFIPTQYIGYKNRYLTTAAVYDVPEGPILDNTLFIHNSKEGKRACFYSLQHWAEPNIKRSTLTVDFNPEYERTKVFDSLFFSANTYIIDTGSQYYDVTANIIRYVTDQYGKTFNVVSFINDHQYTGEITLYPQFNTAGEPSNIKRRERVWYTTIPRNIVDASVNDVTATLNHLDETQLFKERMRDRYLTVMLEYDNKGGISYGPDDTRDYDTFIVNNIGINYRISIR